MSKGNIGLITSDITSIKYEAQNIKISFGLIKKKNQVVCLRYIVACLASSLQTSGVRVGGALETESGEDSDRQQERD